MKNTKTVDPLTVFTREDFEALHVASVDMNLATPEHKALIHKYNNYLHTTVERFERGTL